MKKVLVLGGTGAMGVYLVPKLLKKGYAIDVVSLDEIKSETENLRYITANAMDDEYMAELLKNGYDAIVDFMIYNTVGFKKRHKMMLENCKHYMFLSTYRVYGDLEHPITEQAPRMVDIPTDDKEYIESDDYSLTKARQEDILRASGYNNWTIFRPSITYSQRKFQLTTLEAYVFVDRARAKKPIIVPEEALDKKTVLTWGGDVAEMMARLIFREDAFGEAYTPASSESKTWREIMGIYEKLLGAEFIPVDTDTYLKIFNINHDRLNTAIWQLKYDRLYDRTIDNSKILKATGLKQSDLMPIEKGLTMELNNLPEGAYLGPDELSLRMDDYFAGKLG